MNELDELLRHQLIASPAERALPRAVEMDELAVEVGGAEQIAGELEVAGTLAQLDRCVAQAVGHPAGQRAHDQKPDRARDIARHRQLASGHREGRLGERERNETAGDARDEPELDREEHHRYKEQARDAVLGIGDSDPPREDHGEHHNSQDEHRLSRTHRGKGLRHTTDIGCGRYPFRRALRVSGGRYPACNEADSRRKGLIGPPRRLVELVERTDIGIRGVPLCLPRRPGVVDVSGAGVLALDQGEHGVEPVERGRVGLGERGRRCLRADQRRDLVEVGAYSWRPSRCLRLNVSLSGVGSTVLPLTAATWNL